MFFQRGKVRNGDLHFFFSDPPSLSFSLPSVRPFLLPLSLSRSLSISLSIHFHFRNLIMQTFTLRFVNLKSEKVRPTVFDSYYAPPPPLLTPQFPLINITIQVGTFNISTQITSFLTLWKNQTRLSKIISSACFSFLPLSLFHSTYSFLPYSLLSLSTYSLSLSLALFTFLIL